MKAVPAEAIPAWKRDGDDLHLPFTFHCLRHGANTAMLKLGIPPHVVAAQLGHRPDNRSMTMHYAHVDEDDLVALAVRMARALAQGTTGGTTARGRTAKTG